MYDSRDKSFVNIWNQTKSIGDTLMVTVWIKYLTLSPLKKNGTLQALFPSFAEIYYDIPGVLLQQEFNCDRHSEVLNTQDGAHGKIT